jgi:hypothetical protein
VKVLSLQRADFRFRTSRDRFRYRIARQFGLKIIPTKPALVPLVFKTALAKVIKIWLAFSLDSVVSCGKESFREIFSSLIADFQVRHLANFFFLEAWLGSRNRFAADKECFDILQSSRESKKELGNF